LNEQKSPQENYNNYCQIRVILEGAITYGGKPCYFGPSDPELGLNCLWQEIPRCASPRRDISRSVWTRKSHCGGKDERDSGGPLNLSSPRGFWLVSTKEVERGLWLDGWAVGIIYQGDRVIFFYIYCWSKHMLNVVYLRQRQKIFGARRI
jgi:hypothetical protein